MAVSAGSVQASNAGMTKRLDRTDSTKFRFAVIKNCSVCLRRCWLCGIKTQVPGGWHRFLVDLLGQSDGRQRELFVHADVKRDTSF